MRGLATERVSKMLALQKFNNPCVQSERCSVQESHLTCLPTALPYQESRGVITLGWLPGIFPHLSSASLDPSPASLPQLEKSQWLREGEGDILRASLYVSLSRPRGVRQHSALELSEGRVITGPLFKQTHMECPLQTTFFFYYIIFCIGQWY